MSLTAYDPLPFFLKGDRLSQVDRLDNANLKLGMVCLSHSVQDEVIGILLDSFEELQRPGFFQIADSLLVISELCGLSLVSGELHIARLSFHVGIKPVWEQSQIQRLSKPAVRYDDIAVSSADHLAFHVSSGASLNLV